MSNDVYGKILNIERRNWNRRLSPQKQSIIYELVDSWIRRIESTIQSLSNLSVINITDEKRLLNSEIADNIGTLYYNYMKSIDGSTALYIEQIVLNLPWNLGYGKQYIKESSQILNHYIQNRIRVTAKNQIVIKDSELRAIINEAIREEIDKLLNGSPQYNYLMS
jgi:hypothetical protein